MKLIRGISLTAILLFVVLVLTSQAAISPTLLLDAAAEMSVFGFNGTYVAYVNRDSRPTEVNYYHTGTDVTATIQEGGEPVFLVGIGGNTILYKTYDQASFHDGRIKVYDIPSGTTTQIDTYLTYTSTPLAIGDGHIIYEKTDIHGDMGFIYLKTVSGTTIWQSSNVHDDFIYSFNINNGYAMYCSDNVHIHDLATNTHFTIPVAADAFMADSVDTDGTTIIFTECGSYPNEFLRLVTYNISSGTKNSFAVPIESNSYQIDNGKIYYVDTVFNPDGSRAALLYRMDIDGTSIEQISESSIAGFIIKNGKIVALDNNDRSKLWFYDTSPYTVTVTGRSVSIDWSAMGAASSYTLYYALPNASGEVDIATLGFLEMGQHTSWSISDLPARMTIFSAIVAHKAEGDVLSNIEKFTTAAD